MNAKFRQSEGLFAGSGEGVWMGRKGKESHGRKTSGERGGGYCNYPEESLVGLGQEGRRGVEFQEM